MSTLEIQAQFPYYSHKLWHPYRYKVVYGGRGAGRSWTVARILLVKAMEKPLRVLCAREMQKSIRDSVHRLLTDQIELLGLPGYEITQTEIRHTSGSVFLFEGLRYNTNRVKSMEGIDVCWVEEAERVSKESWDILIPTIRKSGSEIWITFNPDQEDDATYQRFVVNPPPNALVLKVNWRDNPWFPEELREEKDYLYKVDPDAAAWVWEGETRQITDAQILKGKIVVAEFEPEKGWQGPYHGLDFGFAGDPTAAVRVWIRPPKEKRRGVRLPGSLMVEREAFKVHLDIHKTLDYLNRFIPHINKQVVRADSARPETISYLKQHGMPRIVPVVKWPGSIEDGIAHLRKYEEIVIHPRCVHTRQEARLWSYKVDLNTGEVLPIVVDRHNNTWDAVRYALAPIIRAGRRLPHAGYTGMTYTNPS